MTTAARSSLAAAALLLVALQGCGGRIVSPAQVSTGANIAERDAARESVLYSFLGSPDGWNPFASLVTDGTGAFYGTTVIGGGCRTFYYGCGTVFKLTPSPSGYKESVIYRFAGAPDGEAPSAPLALGSGGRLYGTTYAGGTLRGFGSVFELTPSASGYTESVIHHFTGSPSDGEYPYGGVAVDKAGNLYGTTYEGGAFGAGTLYELTPASGSYAETILHNFRGVGDGGASGSTVTLDSNGTIYGTTYDTIFKATKSTFATLYTLRSRTEGKNLTGSLLVAKDGTLYGTAQGGGRGQCGTVFRLSPSGSQFSVLHAFRCIGKRSTDGGFPQAGVISDASGSLYGTAVGGGNTCNEGTCGVVYKLVSGNGGYREKVLWRFEPDGEDGNQPFGGVIWGSDGALYGTTGFGGVGSGAIYGTVFRVQP